MDCMNNFLSITDERSESVRKTCRSFVMSGWSSEMLELRLKKNQAEPTTPSTLNVLGNRTSCGEQLLRYGNTEKVLIGGVLIILTVSTICGNFLLVLSVCLVKKLKQPSNYLIVSLAVADLAVAVVVMPFVSITDLIGGHWIFGQLFCNVFIAMDVLCCTASILTLCVISIDRSIFLTSSSLHSTKLFFLVSLLPLIMIFYLVMWLHCSLNVHHFKGL